MLSTETPNIHHPVIKERMRRKGLSEGGKLRRREVKGEGAAAYDHVRARLWTDMRECEFNYSESSY